MVFSKVKLAQLRRRFFAQSAVAVGANLGIVFFVGWLLGGLLFGAFLTLGYIVCFGLVPVLVVLSSVTNFKSPPFAFFPDSTYPILAKEWYSRLRSHGFPVGKIAYLCDITNGHEEKKLYVGVTFRHFMKEPVLIISESILANVEGPHLVAFLEHEIAHLRSGQLLVRCLMHSLTLLGNALLHVCVHGRVSFAYFHCLHISCMFYQAELALAHISSRPAEHSDELVSDALAVEAIGNPFDMQEALLWLAIAGHMDLSEHEHNEHLSTHPTLEKRISSIQDHYS